MADTVTVFLSNYPPIRHKNFKTIIGKKKKLEEKTNYFWPSFPGDTETRIP